jgi:hypothetical protein
MSVVCDETGQRGEEAVVDAGKAKVPALLFLLSGPGLWIDACAVTELDAIWDTGVHKWAGMAGASDEERGDRI